MSAEKRHEVDMARLIAGELDPRSKEGKQALEEAGISSSELEELRGLAGELDEAARVREEIGAEAARFEDAPGTERIAATLDELAGDARGSGGAAGGRSRWLGWLLPAAGLLLLAPLVFRWAFPEREQLMGEESVRITALQGELGRYGPIEFEVQDPQPGTELVLLVYEADDPVLVDALHEYPLEQSPWSDPPEQAHWPDRVQVRIEMRRFGQAIGDSALLELSRR